MISPEQIIKIRALANDKRGDPAIRETAQRRLDSLRVSHPHLFPAPPRRQKRHPGLRESDEYARCRFADLDRWRKSAQGKRTTVVIRHDTPYWVTLFRHKGAYGWIARNDLDTDNTEFSANGYSTMREAQDGAWQWLQTI